MQVGTAVVTSPHARGRARPGQTQGWEGRQGGGLSLQKGEAAKSRREAGRGGDTAAISPAHVLTQAPALTCPRPTFSLLCPPPNLLRTAVCAPLDPSSLLKGLTLIQPSGRQRPPAPHGAATAAHLQARPCSSRREQGTRPSTPRLSPFHACRHGVCSLCPQGPHAVRGESAPASSPAPQAWAWRLSRAQ